jgi:DNA-binding LacI/PurR family transcriptional regulator
LIGLGHKRIAFISGPIGTSSRSGRLAGMNSELEKAGITPDESLVWGGGNVSKFGDSRSAELGRTAIRELLTLDNPPTAVLTVNDMYAIGACAGARELGYRVPEDISVVGFDDIMMAEVMQPPLTTIRQPAARMSEIIVSKLIETLESPSEVVEPHVEISAELIVRASTRQL